jgi:hypothetical protein
VSIQVDLPINLPSNMSHIDMLSAKMALVLDDLRTDISNSLKGSGGDKSKENVKIIVRLQVQPWHASSTLTHEAALAVSLFLIAYTLLMIYSLRYTGRPCLPEQLLAVLSSCGFT